MRLSRSLGSKEDELKSLNEVLKQEQLANPTQGKVVVSHNRKITFLKETLLELVDSKERYRDTVTDEIVYDFCESKGGKCWFVKLVVLMLSVAMTELAKEARRINSDVIFSRHSKSIL